jgi:ATP-binding cassette subfamily B protein
MSRATSDVEGVRVFIAESLTSLLQMLFLFPTALGLMLSMSWRLTAIVCGLFPVLGYAVVMFRGRIRPRYLEAQEQYGRVATALQENLAGMRLIQAYRREASEVQRFHQLNQDLLRANLAAARERAVFFPLILLLGSSMGAVILWFGGSQVIAGTLTLGELVAFLGYLGVLSRPIMLLGWVISLAQRAIASLTRIEEILSLAPALPSPPMPVAHASQDPVLVFDRVDFAYNGRPILQGINLQGCKGELIAITGPSGAGKSTLAHLIPRLYDVSAGKILLHGVDVQDLPLPVLRSRVAVVPQESFLFSASVADNLAFGRPDASPEAIERMAQGACLWESVQAFPRGLATMVGERGITLSGGQKQRVTLGRALLYGGDIIVLDDPFSNVDAETEEQLLATVRAAARDRLVLLITHRMKTLQAADRIVVVVDGRIVAEGTHAQLLAQGGVYRALYLRQVLRESLSAEDPAGFNGGELESHV